MQEDKSQLMNYAMYGGVFLGLFWMLKYLFVMGAGRIPALSILGSFLAIGTPLILFYFLVKYKTAIVNNSNMGYWHGVQFGIMLFFFASLLEAVIVFIHITWVDQAFVGKLYENMIETVRMMNLSESMVNSLEDQPLPTTVNYIFSNVILADVFIGTILSLFVVPFARMYTPANRKSSI